MLDFTGNVQTKGQQAFQVLKLSFCNQWPDRPVVSKSPRMDIFLDIKHRMCVMRHISFVYVGPICKL